MTQFKKFLIKYKLLKLNINGLRLSERSIKNDLICYIFNITVTYDYFYLKTAKVLTKIEVVENCSGQVNGYNYELEESRNLYIIQFLFGVYFLYKAVITWYNLARIIERINWKLRNPNQYSPKESVELDFNFYRFMLSRNLKSSVITKLDLRYFSTVKICFKLIRPLYYICLFGYLVQILSSALNLYGVYYMEEVSQVQMNMTAIAIMCSWIDLYTITSQSNESGLVNDTFLQVYKQFLYFTAYILIVIAAFASFAICIFNQSIYFANLVSTVTALFAFMYGDNIRATFLTYQDNPFAIVFLVSIIVVLFSCLAQFYLAVFTIKFQSTSEKTMKMMTMVNKNKEGFIRIQKEIIDSKSKNFGEEIQFLMEYLDRKSKVIRSNSVQADPFEDEVALDQKPVSKSDTPTNSKGTGEESGKEKDSGQEGDSGKEKNESERRVSHVGMKKKRDLDEDITSTFNEVMLPEKQKSLLRKT